MDRMAAIPTATWFSTATGISTAPPPAAAASGMASYFRSRPNHETPLLSARLRLFPSATAGSIGGTHGHGAAWFSSLLECRAEIVHQIIYILGSHRDPHQVGGNALLMANFRRNAGVRHVVRQADGRVHTAEAHRDGEQLRL